jgi:hypothetical protein
MYIRYPSEIRNGGTHLCEKKGQYNYLGHMSQIHLTYRLSRSNRLRIKDSSRQSNPYTGLLQVPTEGSHIWRQSTHEGGNVVSPAHWPPLPQGKYSWYSFLSKAKSTPVPQDGRKDYANQKFQRHRESNPRLFRL